MLEFIEAGLDSLLVFVKDEGGKYTSLPVELEYLM